MAESWTFSKDCRELTFKLRRDVKWHDGQAFTAADVVFTYHDHDQSEDPGALQGRLPGREGRRGARIPYTVRVTYGTPVRARARRPGATTCCPGIALEPYVASGQAPGVAPEPASDRHRSVPFPGVADGGEGRAPSPIPTYYGGPPVHRPRGVPGDSEPGHDLSRAEGEGGGLRPHPHRLPVHAPDRLSRRSARPITSSGIPSGVLHVPRLQPEGPALRRSPGARAFAHAINKQRADRRRRARAGPRGRTGRSARGRGPTPTT